MQNYRECFEKVRKDCVKYIQSQETKKEKFKNKDQMIKSHIIPLCFWINKKRKDKKTLLVGLAGGQGTGKTTISTLLKLLPLIFIIFLGAANFNIDNLPEINPTDLSPISLLATVTTLVMWSFIGIETATVPADNVINPQETIPKVLIASVITILIIYILVSFSIAAIVPASELINSSAPFLIRFIISFI